MNILVVTHNLNVNNSHLMPWRTICEVVENLRACGHQAEIVSLGVQNREIKAFAREIRKSKNYLAADLARVADGFSPEVIYWPLTWRESPARLKIISETGLPVVGYFPGGYYSFLAVFYALKRIGFVNVAPYFLETFFEKIRGANFFRRYGVQNVITLSRMHGQMAEAAGWQENEVFYIPPGKDDESESDGILPDDFSVWLEGRQYFLFMGPPGAIRGIFELLEAFDVVAGKRDDVYLVCLFRDDATIDSVKIREKIVSLKFGSRVFVVWKSVSKEVLQFFIKKCHAVLLPFVLVPSEIPLAIIESMAWGKPVVGTVPGGTGEFVRDFGAVANLGDIDGLASVMVRLVVDANYYHERCQLTSEKYIQHPDWRAVSLKWLQVGEIAVSGRIANERDR